MSQKEINIGLLRHFRDLPDVDGGRDVGIAPVSKAEISATANSIVQAAEEISCTSVVLITSSLKRAMATNNAIADMIVEHDPRLEVKSITDQRIASLTHGEYADKCTTEKESMAWLAYVNETFVERNPLYRHGDPKINGGATAKYPELLEMFSRHGEHQWDFTRRLLSFVYGLIVYAEKGGLDETMVILCSHTAIIMRAIELSSLAQRKAVVPIGEMYLAEWDELDRIIDNPITTAALKPGGFSVLPFNHIFNYADRIDSELKYLRITPGLAALQS